MYNTRQIRSRDSDRSTHRHPIFREIDLLTWLQESVGLLIAKESALNFRVCAVVVGKSFSPIQAVRIHAPRPDLFRRKLTIFREVRRSSIRMWMPDTHEIFTAGVNKNRNWTVRLVL